MRWTILQLRSRRGLIAALLVLLVALFAARAVVHHVAEDVAPPSAIGHHDDGHQGLALHLVAAAAGFLMLSAFVAGATGAAARGLHPRRAALRAGPSAAATRSSRRTLRRVELQSFLT